MHDVENKIRNIRELKNLTQTYVAGKLGISQAAYSKIESGFTKVHYDKLAQIANILEIDISTLLNFDGQKLFTMHNMEGNNNGLAFNATEIDIKGLYEDKIRLLEKLLAQEETRLRHYADRYGEL